MTLTRNQILGILLVVGILVVMGVLDYLGGVHDYSDDDDLDES